MISQPISDQMIDNHYSLAVVQPYPSYAPAPAPAPYHPPAQPAYHQPEPQISYHQVTSHTATALAVSESAQENIEVLKTPKGS